MSSNLKMAKEANWDGTGLLCDHMAEVERNAGAVTLKCLAYRALRWKYNMEIPDYLHFLKEPTGYQKDYKAIGIDKIYDQAIEVGLKTRERVFVKHGLWNALSKFKKLEEKSFKQLMGRGSKSFIYKRYKFCFICYLKDKSGYPYIENDLPHDRYIAICCEEVHFKDLLEDYKHMEVEINSANETDEKVDRIRRVYMYVARYLKGTLNKEKNYFEHVRNLLNNGKEGVKHRFKSVRS